MVPLCLADPGGRVPWLARPRFALAALLGATYIRVSLSDLWIDSMRSGIGPRKHRFRTPVEPNDVRCLSRCRVVRCVRDWHALVRIAAIAPNRHPSQD